MDDKKVTVLVWDEGISGQIAQVYPAGIRGAIAKGLRRLGRERLEVHTTCLADAEEGLAQDVLDNIDVLFWWGHAHHLDVSDEAVYRVIRAVFERGMGFVALHSAHLSKPFRILLNTGGRLLGGWREDNRHEIVRVCAPQHPIARGVTDFTIPAEEMYGAPFEVPPPEVVVLQSFFPAGGEYFPSGLTWTVGPEIVPDAEKWIDHGSGQGHGRGRIFYFRPGHESLPTFQHPKVRRILYNAALWAGKAE